MNLADFCFWGVSRIDSFTKLVRWISGSYFEILFIIWVLNITFSFFKKIVFHLGGIK